MGGGVQTCIPKRKLLVGLPLGHNGSHESSQESRAVKEHVEGVRDEPQAVGPHAVEQLHKGKGEVQEKEEEQVTRALLRQDGPKARHCNYTVGDTLFNFGIQLEGVAPPLMRGWQEGGGVTILYYTILYFYTSLSSPDPLGYLAGKLEGWLGLRLVAYVQGDILNVLGQKASRGPVGVHGQRANCSLECQGVQRRIGGS